MKIKSRWMYRLFNCTIRTEIYRRKQAFVLLDPIFLFIAFVSKTAHFTYSSQLELTFRPLFHNLLCYNKLHRTGGGITSGRKTVAAARILGKRKTNRVIPGSLRF